ncbi:MAG: hypothetical protein ACE5OQ_10160 [Woeseia sp.]
MRACRTVKLSFLATLAIGVVACVAESPALNSERIARNYGSYGIVIIENKDNIRVSNLYSHEAAGPVCRTFAVVGLTDTVDAAFADEHALITAGGSIGAVFRHSGWDISKRHRYIGEMPIGEKATRLVRLMRIKPPATLAVHIYVLAVSKGERSFDYAMIAEVHHPDYLTTGKLRSIYGSGYSADTNRSNAKPVLVLLRGKFRDPLVQGPDGQMFGASVDWDYTRDTGKPDTWQ